MEAVVRALTGADEALVADNGYRPAPAAGASVLIAAATRRIGRIQPTLAEVRELAVGDRERLLLALYRASFGGRIEAVAGCSDPGCGARMELELEVEELLGPVEVERPEGVSGPFEPGAKAEPGGEEAGDEPGRLARGSEYELVLADDGQRIRFRLPSGADQEHAARIAASDSVAAAEAILHRCLVAVIDGAGQPGDAEALPAGWRERLAEACAGLDPQATTEMELACPECGAVSAAQLDAATFLMAELGRSDGVFAEVDRLARTYHWSEAEILALPVGRRRRYLTLAAEG